MSRYPVTGAHIRIGDSLTTHSIHSNDPQVIIEWMADWIEHYGGHYEVWLDHDYSKERDARDGVGRVEDDRDDPER